MTQNLVMVKYRQIQGDHFFAWNQEEKYPMIYTPFSSHLVRSEDTNYQRWLEKAANTERAILSLYWLCKF